MKNNRIPIVDLFAGPGGLGEGFTHLRKNGEKIFDIVLSIEKDPEVHKTLMLRSIFRKFDDGKAPDCYYEYISGRITKDDFLNNPLIKELAKEASNEVKNVALGEIESSTVDRWILEKIQKKQDWILIGGPPCQAYSLAGRSKMINLDRDKYEGDHRHLLYKEYLRIIEKHSPPVFIMENVKGILSSKFNKQLIFHQILSDLKNPKKGLEYEIRSLVVEGSNEDLSPSDFIIKSELYGIPQARHRVILFGIRKDLAKKNHKTLKVAKELITVDDVLRFMPHIRSKLSKGDDSFNNWRKVLKETKSMLAGWDSDLKKLVVTEMDRNVQQSLKKEGIGSAFIEGKPIILGSPVLNKWLIDPRLNGFIQHEARSHMHSDIQRYFFLSSYAKMLERSPKISEFPPKLLPKHQNAGSINAPFQDRFRVQLGNHPSTTIVSHISKDGHYYIHPDPSQARSLTVREAARLQTFPDNYFFEGNKTSQYSQVGNAVPPLLANQIAKIVFEFLQ